MTTAENKELMRQIFSELSEGNSKPLVEAMADDVRWTVTGTTRWSRTYEGKEAVLGELLQPLRSRLSGRLKLTAHRFIAEDDLVVVEARGRGTTKTGLPYDNTYCFIYRIAGGRIQELIEYPDTLLVETALTA